MCDTIYTSDDSENDCVLVIHTYLNIKFHLWELSLNNTKKERKHSAGKKCVWLTNCVLYRICMHCERFEVRICIEVHWMSGQLYGNRSWFVFVSDAILLDVFMSLD